MHHIAKIKPMPPIKRYQGARCRASSVSVANDIDLLSKSASKISPTWTKLIEVVFTFEVDVA